MKDITFKYLKLTGVLFSILLLMFCVVGCTGKSTDKKFNERNDLKSIEYYSEEYCELNDTTDKGDSEGCLKSNTVTSSSSESDHSYTKNNMTVGIIGKNDNEWIIELTNNTGVPQIFEYNTKMCFENNAKNWKGLKDITRTRLVENKQSTLIGISESGFATSIVISYKDSNYRKVFYAKNLSKSCTMTAMDNTIEFLST